MHDVAVGFRCIFMVYLCPGRHSEKRTWVIDRAVQMPPRSSGPAILERLSAVPKGNAEKSLSWLFSARKSKSAVFDFLHFQSLTAIENAWPSLASLGSALNQRFPLMTSE